MHASKGQGNSRKHLINTRMNIAQKVRKRRCGNRNQTWKQRRPKTNTCGPPLYTSSWDERLPSCVLFLKRIPNGELCTWLRQVEAMLSQTLKKKVKIVERNGPHFQSLLTRSDPWAREKCEIPTCKVCQIPDESTQNCRQTNMTYRTMCWLCIAVGYSSVYIGESSRSLSERFWEHVEDKVQSHGQGHPHDVHTPDGLGAAPQGWGCLEVLQTGNPEDPQIRFF